MQVDIKGIEDAALRARAIVQQLLTFARRSRPQPQPVALAPLIHATLARLAQSLEANAIQTVIDIPDDRCVISGDLDQIEQVLFNILNNAVQALATNQRAAPRELRISAECDGDTVHLAIVDSGPGIAPEHLPHIFDPFFTTRSIGEGTGLGLAIVHAIVQQHRGRVWAQNNPERGMTLHVQLRAVEREEPRVAEGWHGPTKSGARILVVDDEELIRTVVRRMLAEHSFLVDAVASGEEALGCAQGQDYDLILCDLHMPGLDGQALYQRLHQLRPSQRWLILTGDTMGEPSRAFLERTGLPVLAKPFTQDQLLACVAECVGAAKH
jgi:two-component system, cell cycle sensor histidine kinase and response regulator CckA